MLLGIEEIDDQSDVDWLEQKIAGMRIFSDDEGRMNLSVADVGGEVLIVSQFTLHASTKKGNRPGFTRAARPEKAIPLYESFIDRFEGRFPGKIQTGSFGAMMSISLVNEGPVTIPIDSRQRE